MKKLLISLAAILISTQACATEWSTGPLKDGPKFAPGANPPGATIRIEDPKEYRGIKTQGLTDEIVGKILEKKRAGGCPDRPDLDITYIERTPRFPRYYVSYNPGGKNPYLSDGKDPETGKYDRTKDDKHIQRYPSDGETVTFWGHIANKGLKPSNPSSYVFYLDGKVIAEGTIPAIEPCDQVVVTAEWPWESGRHTITLMTDLDNENVEVTKTNNRHTDYTDAYTFFWTIRDLVYIEEEGHANNYGSYSCEDWHKSVMEWMNERFASCIYPSAPNGILARVRIEYLWISEKPWEEHDAHPLSRFTDGTWPHYPGGRVDLATATEEEKKKLFENIEIYMKDNARFNSETYRRGVDGGLPHELSHQLGMIDIYHFNIPAGLCQVKMEDGRLLRDVLPEKAGVKTWQKGIMSGAGVRPQVWEELHAIALNNDLGRRRGFFGDFLLDLPKDCVIKILDSEGKPIAGAELKVYHREDHAVPDEVKHKGKTDKEGLFSLGGKPVGDVHVVGYNSSLLIRVMDPKTEKVDWVWTDIAKFIIEKHRGNADKAIVEVRTEL